MSDQLLIEYSKNKNDYIIEDEMSTNILLGNGYNLLEHSNSLKNYKLEEKEEDQEVDHPKIKIEYNMIKDKENHKFKA